MAEVRDPVSDILTQLNEALPGDAHIEEGQDGKLVLMHYHPMNGRQYYQLPMRVRLLFEELVDSAISLERNRIKKILGV